MKKWGPREIRYFFLIAGVIAVGWAIGWLFT